MTEKQDLKTFTTEDISTWRPLRTPPVQWPAGWTGTALDVLGHSGISMDDKFWVVLREECIPVEILHEFSVECAWSALVAAGVTDPRSWAALDAKMAWLRGDIEDAELVAVWKAAFSAAEKTALKAKQARDGVAVGWEMKTAMTAAARAGVAAAAIPVAAWKSAWESAGALAVATSVRWLAWCGAWAWTSVRHGQTEWLVNRLTGDKNE